MKKFILSIVFFITTLSTVFSQNTINNTIWLRDLPEHGIQEYLHLIGNDRAFLLTVVGGSKTVSTGYYMIESNNLIVDFFGLDRKYTIESDKISHGKFVYRKFSEPFNSSNEILFKDLIDMYDPFTKKKVKVSEVVPEKYYGEYIMDGTWKTKIVLSKTNDNSIYWKQTVKPGSYRGDEFVWDQSKDFYNITWGFLQEEGKMLLTNPVVSASINNHGYSIFENCPILIFDLGDGTSSYCFVIEQKGSIYLVYNWTVFKKM